MLGDGDMTEADILALSFSANEAVSGLFSIFFGMVSAYIAGLYFFLNRAPLTLKLIAFALLTMGFLFIGQSMAGIESRLFGLVRAWETIGTPTTGIVALNKLSLPLPLRDLFDATGIQLADYDGNRWGMYSGWLLSVLVYVALAYATFVYRWPRG